MADVPITPLNRAGVFSSVTGQAATAADSFQNDGTILLSVNNASASVVVVTLQATQTVDGAIPAPKTVSIPAAAVALIGPFQMSQYNQQSPTSQPQFNFSVAPFVTVTLKALKPTP